MSFALPMDPGHHIGPGRKTLYTHHRQIFKTQHYFHRRRDPDRESQRTHSAAADIAWVNAVLDPDAPHYLKRWRSLAKKGGILRRLRVRR